MTLDFMKYFRILPIAVLMAGSLLLTSCGDDDDDDDDGPDMPETTIASAATDAGFNALLAAATAAGLDGALADGNSTFTVFAPTDEAFATFLADLGVSSVDEIDEATLTAVLQYHLLGSVKTSSDLGTSETTLTGSDIFINIGAATINGVVNITQTDISTDNGVIHVIDQVLVEPTQNVVEIAQASAPEFTTLVDALVDQDLAGTLSGDGPFTVFAPTNAAFEALGIDLSTLSDAELTDILTYHVVAGKVYSVDLSAGDVAALNEENLTIGLDGGVTVQGANNGTAANVTTANINGTNGVIHVIDQVLLPPKTVVDVAVFNGFTSLVAAVTAADLAGTLSGAGPFTVFAPTDDAFATFLADNNFASLDDVPVDLLTEVLLYHVVSGDVRSTDLMNGFVPTLSEEAVEIDLTNGVMVNTATVTLADVVADNGVVHVIDEVLFPAQDDVVQVAIDNGFNALAAALTEAGLVETLQDAEGDFTVFAPTDEAFEALYNVLGVDGPDEVDDATLEATLLYHVLGSRVFSSDLSDGIMPATLSSELTFTVNINGGVSITDNEPDLGDANVTLTDVQASNGVVHVIDAVLVPVDLP